MQFGCNDGTRIVCAVMLHTTYGMDQGNIIGTSKSGVFESTQSMVVLLEIIRIIYPIDPTSRDTLILKDSLHIGNWTRITISTDLIVNNLTNIILSYIRN